MATLRPCAIPPERFWQLGVMLVAFGFSLRSSAQEGASVIKTDEAVEFFPTAARLTEDRTQWLIPIHGWIYEPERNSVVRRVLIDQLRNSIVDLDASLDRDLVEQRLWRFVVDNERDKRVTIEIAEREIVLPASAADGHFEETVALAARDVETASRDGVLEFRAALNEGDDRQIIGRVRLVPPTGVAVISDIDDTVKITEVLDKRKMLRNTLAEPFRTAPGMAERYRGWAAEGASFHYISGSPWQLHADLSAMLDADHFPMATLTLRRVRLKDTSMLELFRSPVEFKLDAIESALAAWPERDFILVGDSGEKDPEVYGEISRRFPDKVRLIAIRNVTDEERTAERFQQAFRGVDPERWELFSEPASLPAIAKLKPLPLERP